MKLTQFLHKNILWNFNKNTFADLCALPCSEEQLLEQLHRLADKYFPERKGVETAYTEFCLNELMLFPAHTPQEKCVKQHLNRYWQQFVRLKNLFDKKYMLFPADTQPRIMRIANLIAASTQFAVTPKTLMELCAEAVRIFDLEEREERNLQNALELAQINFFCAVARGIFNSEEGAEQRLAKMIGVSPLNFDFQPNTHLRHCYYVTNQLVVNVDCLANSAAQFKVPTAVDVKPYFFVRGKNVFDTFCLSKFGQKSAEFCSQSDKLKVTMQYFAQNNFEVRNYTLQNLTNCTKTLTADFLFRHNSLGKVSYFEAHNALCMAVEGAKSFYCALAFVENNKIAKCPFEEGRISHNITLQKCAEFSVVTVYADSMPALAQSLDQLDTYGSTRCPFLLDKQSQNVTDFPHPLCPTMHGHAKRETPKKKATTLNFTYQLGNENVGTFLDNAGNSTTLLNGFCFGVQGECVYSVKNGRIAQLNKGKYLLDGDKILYKHQKKSCQISHPQNKIYQVEYIEKQKTLFYFPLEEKSKITFDNNTFYVEGQLRQFEVKCHGKVESFTTNALECNTERLRYKLSDQIACGSCLAVCFASANAVSVEIANKKIAPKQTPIIRESLLSTYLNYVNSKNLFCLQNYLKRADSLTLAAITYTNPNFVKKYLTETFGRDVFFYDKTGRKKSHYDNLTLPLAAIYYASLIKDDTFPSAEMKREISSVLFGGEFDGYNLCIKALALKKAAHVEGFDKVRCLVEYNNTQKLIQKDAKLLAYAQAIGAESMPSPCKSALRDLCAKFDIPKSWYYVSQLENLYGMSVVGGALSFKPKVSEQNVLEQFAINLYGKRIDTVFQKSAVQSMTLNGNDCRAPFLVQSLKKAQNNLVVRY